MSHDVDTNGIHLLLDYWGCEPEILGDTERIEDLMHKAAEATGAVVIDSMFKRFDPQGVSGVVVIKESHLSIHTWPERGYAAVDVFTCGRECQPTKAHPVIKKALGSFRYEGLTILRGLEGSSSMRINSNYS